MSRLRYAVIGCGRRGASHLATASQMTHSLELVAVCDAHPPSAQQAAERYGVPAYTDVREMVARESPDLCSVVVPAELHHVISVYLSQHGIHQNVETPIAPTLGLADLMIEAAARNNVVLQVSENFPFIPVEQMVQAIIRSGAVGKVGRCYRLFSTSGYHGLAAIRMRIGAAPIAVSSCAHTMPVAPYTDRMGRRYTEEGFEFALVDFANDALGVVVVGNKNSCLGRNHLVGFETIGERGSIITNGNQDARGGEMVYIATDEDIAHNYAMARAFPFQREDAEIGGRVVPQRIWVDLPDGTIEWRNPYAHLPLSEMYISIATMLDGLATAIRDHVEPLWPGTFGRADQEMVLAMGRSIANNRQPVSLPLPVNPDEEERFNRSFEERFRCRSHDIEKALDISFKAF